MLRGEPQRIVGDFLLGVGGDSRPVPLAAAAWTPGELVRQARQPLVETLR